MSESLNMNYEESRLSTFSSWPANAKVEAWKMAKAGLLYTGRSEDVECTFCGCVLSDWQYGDQVMSKHRQANPGCPFVLNQSDNVPLGQSRIRSPRVEDHDMVDGEGRDVEQVDEVSLTTDTSRISDMSAVDFSPSTSQMEINNVNSLHDEMRREDRRLASFAHWEVQFIRPEDLAKAGFYYVNQRDNCRCAFCDNYVGDWDEGDIPMEEHAKLFPLCGFVQGRDVGNVPINAESGNESSSSSPQAGNTSPGHDTTGIRVQRRPNSGPERGFARPRKDYESLGIINHHGPNNPSYATVEARLRTFSEWPPALRQQPQDLADAGFYYIGLSDQVKCFYCDGGLRNWQPEDEPWVEHARWFSKCVFVRLRKGDDFIQNCIETKPPETNEGMHNTYGREVTEDDIRQVMSEAIVRQVLSMGIDPSRVKMAIKKQLQDYGSNFNSTESLLSAALSVHRQQERRVQNEHNNPSGAMLGGQTHSFDEVTSRRWENDTEMYNSTEDEDELPNFNSLPAGVNLAVSKSNSSPTAVATPSKEETPKPAVIKEEAAKSPAVSSPPAGAGAADSLEEENQRLKEQRTCKVCMDGEVGVVFLPCGHLICCVNCAPSLKDCPVCRTNIQGTVRTFMS